MRDSIEAVNYIKKVVNSNNFELLEKKLHLHGRDFGLLHSTFQEPCLA
jgi:hypothetical protein